MHRMKRCAGVVALALLVWAPASAQSPAGVDADPSPDTGAPSEPAASPSVEPAPESAAELEPEEIAISISGGVSLGGYEAGAVWTWVHYLRARNTGAVDGALGQPRAVNLVGFTGASAGGINAVLASMMWCAKDDARRTVDDNLMRTAWTGAGFDGLLPLGSNEDEFLALDGILTRNAFGEALNEVQALLSQDAFRPGCRVPVAVTVTRGQPWVETIDGLQIPNQRFAVPLVLQVDDQGYAWFVNDSAITRNKEQLGHFIMLAERLGSEERRLRTGGKGEPPRWVVPADLVVQTVLATSAFPMAFSPVILPQCIPESKCPDDGPKPRKADLEAIEGLGCDGRESCGDFSDLTCDGLTTTEHPVTVCASRFVDGGFFDNVPLGVAMAQAESRDEGPQIQRVDYVYFDPAVRRFEEQTDEIASDLGLRGLGRVSQIMGSAVGTGRTYELHTTKRHAAFGLTAHHIVDEIGDGLQEMAGIVAGGEAPAGPPLDSAIMACLDAMPLEGLDGCRPLPPQCLALTEERAPIGASGVDVSRRADMALAEARPTIAAAECLPPDADAIEARLDALSVNLRCLSMKPGFDRAAHAGHRRLAAAVVEAVESVRACLGDVPPQERGRMAIARFDADLRSARAFLDGVESTSHERRLRLPSRFAPLAADQLRAFGGFLDEPLRAYDHWVGVYDALINMAEKRCRDRLEAAGRWVTTADYFTCTELEFEALRETLVAHPPPIGDYLLDELWIQERIVRAHVPRVEPWVGCGKDGKRCDLATECSFEAPADQNICRAHKALTRCTGADEQRFKRGDHDEFCPGSLDMNDFIDALEASGYEPVSAYMKSLIEDPRWWATPAMQALSRAASLERDEARRAKTRTAVAAASDDEQARARAEVAREQAASSAARAKAFTAGAYLLRAGLRQHQPFELDPSGIPPEARFSLAQLLPYRIGFDPYNGGVVLGWEPRFGGGQTFEWRILLDAVRWRGDGAGMRSGIAPMLGLRPWRSPVFGAWALGPVLEQTWGSGGLDLGARTHLDLGLDRVRVSVSVLFNRLANADDLPQPSNPRLTIDLSLLDVPGLLWLVGQ